MKRILFGLILALALVFAIGSSSLAAPLSVGEAGSFVIFGEYAPFEIIFNGFVVGAGYAISDGIAIGAEVMFIEDITLFGAFATMSLGSFTATAEIQTIEDVIFADVIGLYMFDLDTIKLGVGGGVMIWPGITFFVIEGAVNFAAGDNFSIYGTVDYIIDLEATQFSVGVALGL